MKNRSIFSVIILIFAVFGLFTACGDPNSSDSTPTYTVSFNAGGGTPAPQSQTVSHGGKVAIPEPMTRTNYGFSGWYTESYCTNEWDFDVNTVTANITLYAEWRYGYTRTFTVSFEANGGTPAPSQRNVPNGSTITTPPPMSKNGYGFDGWYKEVACINEWDFATDTVTKNITLYAKWVTNYFTVNFEANGGTPAPSQQNIVNGRTVVTPPDMTKLGYSFGGWYKEMDCINQWDFVADIVTGNIILYAKWLENFTVTFEADGGSPVPAQQSVIDGHKVSEPATMTKPSYSFGGWYKEMDCINQWDFDHDVVTSNTILYAKWNPPILVPGASWNAKMRWLDTNVESGGAYIIEFDSDENINPVTFSYSGNNISITLKGSGTKRIISFSYASGPKFTVESGITLILGDNLELQGGSSGYSLLRVNSGGNLILNHGAKITGNSASSGNSSTYGGGVYVAGGTFTMNGGEISGNTASSSTRNSSTSGYGGGVYVAGGTFTMNDGEISNNTASSYSGYSSTISYGGGVYVAGGIFTMNDGKISGNTASSGGGVYVVSDYYGSVTFTMSGGEIFGNTASSYAGGVYMGNNTIFNKTGGTIFGYSSGNSKSNAVKDSSELVFQNRGHAIHVKHSNTIYIMGKDTTSGPGDNLSFNGTVTPPSYSGEWDY